MSIDYILMMQTAFVSQDFTRTHTRQLWDFVKSFWMDAAPQSGCNRLCDAAPGVTNESLWKWLLMIYRQQGGGGLSRHCSGLHQQHRLPSSCVKIG